MRRATSVLGLAALVLVAGCKNWPHMRNQRNDVEGPRIATASPTAPQLVAYLNDNAHRVQALQCQDVDLDCSQGLQTVHLNAKMVCQKPRNFRLSAQVVGNTQVDLGSNSTEFWYWIGKADPPYLFHCTHEDFARGNVRMPFPFQPDWIMEAMGIAEYDASKNYTVETQGRTLQLVEQAVSPQGTPVRKVTVFNRGADQVQITGHVLQDQKGKEICTAQVIEVQQDRISGAVLPKRVVLNWPDQKIRLKMKLDGLAVNPQIDAQRTALLFTRPQMQGVPTYDLARGPDGAPIRQARGFSRQ